MAQTDFFKKINPELPLRLGLGAMYLYSGRDLIVNPLHGEGFAPLWFERLVGLVMPMHIYLRVQGAGELMIGFLLLAWFLPRWGVRAASAIAMAEMAGVLILSGVDIITFRDIGLLGGAVALSLMVWRNPSVDNSH